MLRDLGHRSFILEPLAPARPCDLLIALHARRSAAAVVASRAAFPERPIAVALTGTDLYRDIHDDESAQRSLELADRLIVLHGGAAAELPRHLRRKVVVVPQSAPPVLRKPRPDARSFEVAVVGHLRAEKDPLRTALAARLLPASSRLRVTHAGGALSQDFALSARAEEQVNARYRWLGEIPRPAARGLIARARLLALTSAMEGGANVVSEALAAGTPVIATRIPAMVAILGRTYPGLFPLGNTAALARLLVRAETDASFLDRLRRECRAHSSALSPAREKSALKSLVAALRPGRSGPSRSLT